MKSLPSSIQRANTRSGFSLIEATLTLGLMSFGLLALGPVLAVGMKTSHFARDDRETMQIAEAIMESARQGTLTQGTAYLDSEGKPCDSTQATYAAQSTLTQVAGNPFLTRLTLRVVPQGAPDRARTYALVLAPSS